MDHALPPDDYLSVAEQPRQITGDRQFQTDATSAAQACAVLDLVSLLDVSVTTMFWADVGLALEFKSTDDRALYSLAYEGKCA